MNHLTIEVLHLQRGQPRAYAPHIYESQITVTGRNSWDRIDEDRMRALVKLLVHSFFDEAELAAKDSMDAHFSPKLVRLECIATEALSDDALGPHRATWIARIERPFTD